MGILLKILVSLVALFGLGMAVMWMAVPATGATQFSIALTGVQGLSSGRADIGGMFLATAVLSLLGLTGGQFAAAYLHGGAIIMGSVALGRVIGFAIDGAVQMTVVPFIFEVVFVTVLLLAARSLRGDETE